MASSFDNTYVPRNGFILPSAFNIDLGSICAAEERAERERMQQADYVFSEKVIEDRFSAFRLPPEVRARRKEERESARNPVYLPGDDSKINSDILGR